MIPITLHVDIAPGRTQRYAFSQSPVTFGRDPDNAVVLTSQHASRQHGRLEFVDDQWVLINESENGTRVNRRRVTRKAQPLRDGDRVLIGDEQVFRVSLAAAPAEKPQDQDAEQPLTETQRAEQARERRRVKVWIGVGVYLIGMLLLLVMLRTCERPDKQEGERPTALTAEQIESEIRAPLPKHTADAAQYQYYLDLGRERFAQLPRNPGRLYSTYDAFRTALSYSALDRFPDGTDQLMYEDVTTQLVQRVVDEYTHAVRLMDVGQHTNAKQQFQDILEHTYLADSGQLYENLFDMRGYAAQRARGR